MRLSNQSLNALSRVSNVSLPLRNEARAGISSCAKPAKHEKAVHITNSVNFFIASFLNNTPQKNRGDFNEALRRG
jgi:hypothetical protein